MIEKHTYHVIGVPHTVTSKEFVACAFTQKVYKFCKMMMNRGHTVYHYGHEESNPPCTEHITVLNSSDWKKCYGNHDWRKHFFKYDTNDYAYQTFYKNSIREIDKRKGKNDFLLPFWGSGVRPICDAHENDMIVVEPGIGYSSGHWARYKVFESYAIHSAYYALPSVSHCNEDWYTTVIPNYFDPEDFEYSDQKEDYFLFLGRVYEGKGVHIAIQVAQELGVKLVIAGQGSIRDMGYEPNENIIEFGYANAEARKNLMSKAKGAFVASMYNEPFAGVQIECMLSGTPVISTDWGALAELNLHGYTGYRCRTFEQFVWAAKNIDTIKSEDCRTWGENFLYDKVAPMYEEYFSSILNIYGKKGWYEPNENRSDLNWLRKEYPLNRR